MSTERSIHDNNEFDSTRRNGNLSMNAFTIKALKHRKEILID